MQPIGQGNLQAILPPANPQAQQRVGAWGRVISHGLATSAVALLTMKYIPKLMPKHPNAKELDFTSSEYQLALMGLVAGAFAGCLDAPPIANRQIEERDIKIICTVSVLGAAIGYQISGPQGAIVGAGLGAFAAKVGINFIYGPNPALPPALPPAAPPG